MLLAYRGQHRVPGPLGPGLLLVWTRLPILGILALMATNTSISLDEHFATFLADQVGEGRYRSASEVVRAALRLLEERELQLSALRASLDAGEASGEAEDFDLDAFIATKKS
jgi:antitoxin ParD1/3/4